MKPKKILVPILIALWLANIARSADIYKIDIGHSIVGYSISHLVISIVKGKLNEFTGSIVLDNDLLKEAKGTVQTKSLDTGNSQRDTDLRSPNFFDVEKYPTITFTSKRIEKKGGEMIVVGDYTMHGVTKELSLPIKVNGP